MSQKPKAPTAGRAAGPCRQLLFDGNNSSVAQSIAKRNPRAVAEARRELIREAIAEDLDAIVLYIETAQLLIEARDDTGVRYIGPVIEIVVSDDGIAVTDNGPGIAPDVVANIIDYTSRTSSREAYCSPTRGAQGNALKTVIAMGFALDDERGETLVESRGFAHRITFSNRRRARRAASLDLW